MSQIWGAIFRFFSPHRFKILEGEELELLGEWKKIKWFYF
jgi:hypothetical protein